VSRPASIPGQYPLKILFVCSQNKLRSLTAETIFSGSSHYQVKSAGTEAASRIRVTEGMIGWADKIFAMEKNHVNLLREKYREKLTGKQLICLHIPDDYEYMDPELIRVLKTKLGQYIELS
jgi:predicted protein tyrosine phosphatase